MTLSLDWIVSATRCSGFWMSALFSNLVAAPPVLGMEKTGTRGEFGLVNLFTS